MNKICHQPNITVTVLFSYISSSLKTVQYPFYLQVAALNKQWWMLFIPFPLPTPFLPFQAFLCLLQGIVWLGGDVDPPSFLHWHASLKEWRPYLIHNPRWLHKHTTSHQLGNTEMLLKINELIIIYIFFSCNNNSYCCSIVRAVISAG